MTQTTARRRTRRTGAGFDLAAYEAEMETFSTAQGEAQWANLSGFRAELDLAPVYARHADLFSGQAIDHLRRAAGGTSPAAARARRLLHFAVSGHLEREVATITDRIAIAESTAVVMWRGERIGYRQAPIRVAELNDRTERNALDERYRLAVEAINPLREERWERLHQQARALGAADYVALSRETSGVDPEAVAADAQRMLNDTETVYYAALRRYLALIEIEGGDATAADAAHLLRGRAWDHFFDAGHLLDVLATTLRGLGIDLANQSGITLDIEHRPMKSARAFCAPVRVPGDVRFAIQPRGGHDDYGSALHELGHLQHFAHVAASLPPADRYLGDESVTEGWAFLFHYLMVEPEWLAVELRMPRDVIAGWLDFAAFRKLYVLRRYAAKLLYELRLHRGGPWGLRRTEYAGMLGLLTGVLVPEASFLADVDDGLFAARYLRAWQLEGCLVTAFGDRFGPTWWRIAEAGALMRTMWGAGLGPSAEDVVASLGYDHLDWRPVLRQIRAQLIGEMSGYGGPNITTRAGSRKV